MIEFKQVYDIDINKLLELHTLYLKERKNMTSEERGVFVKHLSQLQRFSHLVRYNDALQEDFLQKGEVCEVCGKENPDKNQSFCADLGCSGRMVEQTNG